MTPPRWHARLGAVFLLQKGVSMSDLAKLTVTIVRDECIGDGACCSDAPTTFEIDDEGKAIVLEASTDDLNTILTAARNCPTLAIIVHDKATGKKLFPED
jgi:ferredoxin